MSVRKLASQTSVQLRAEEAENKVERGLTQSCCETGWGSQLVAVYPL